MGHQYLFMLSPEQARILRPSDFASLEGIHPSSEDESSSKHFVIADIAPALFCSYCQGRSRTICDCAHVNGLAGKDLALTKVGGWWLTGSENAGKFSASLCLNQMFNKQQQTCVVTALHPLLTRSYKQEQLAHSNNSPQHSKPQT
ncbi:uncharacterized protein RSE6_00764 [Rhynchosporium secalis]|uniref:Uncharacterized protein n=1 Tax=Rhynchosporium secalis TaxID=38038 RepID=A0A1E1LW65_RHYSE|nr:uncharacterized protein RSE6_00764 [Rhynchosporium secalis]